MNPVSFDEVLATYQKLESMKATAQKLGISHDKVRKILITYDIIDDEIYKQYKILNARGLSDEEICKKLEISKRKLCQHTPYTKGMYYSQNPSENALKIRRCREGKEKIEE